MSDTTQETQAPETEVVQDTQSSAPAETAQATEQPATGASADETSTATTAAPEVQADTQGNQGADAGQPAPAEVDESTTPAVDIAPAPAVTETPAAPEVKEPDPTPAEPVAQPAVEAPQVQVAPDPVAAPVVEETQAAAAQAPVSEFRTLINKILADGTSVEKQVVQRLEAYIDTMAPGKIVSPLVGAKSQFELWSILEFVFDAAPQEEFNKLWSLILAYFKEHENGALGPRYVNRFSEHWMQPLIKLTGLQRLLNLLMVTARPENRTAGLQSLDINKTLTDGITPTGRARILNFYGK